MSSSPAESMRHLIRLMEGRLDEFIPFTTGTAGPALGGGAAMAPSGTAGSTGTSGQAAKQPWEMTRNEVRALPHDTLSDLFWKPAAEHIWKEAGSRDPVRILSFYSRKYALPAIGFEWSNQLSPQINGEAQKDGAGTWKILLSPRLKNSPYESTIVLRHEVEHVIDDENYGFHATAERPVEHPDGQGGIEAVAGKHHKHYGEFNTDYSHRIVVRDALHQGKPVPREVLQDYPDLH
jgi:hypothetical protein